jgi:ABC-type uncharacterized transport system fused permease/ATPase subunit
MGDDKRYARWAGLVLLILSQLSVSFSYFFVQWNKRFYDSLEKHDINLFFKESLIFCVLIIALAIVSSFTKYHGQQYALRWRMWMSNKGLDLWLKKRTNVEGSDQRIQEDLMRFTNIFERFFLDCLNSLVSIILFIPMLYNITSAMTFMSGISLANILVVAIIAYTLIGLYVSTKIANPLVKMEYNNQKIEAHFRYKLVHARDGDNIQTSVFQDITQQINKSYHDIYSTKRNFTLWQKIYDQASYLLPFLLIGSNYFSGAITLGTLMQIRSIFSRIRNAMSYLLDHYSEVTELWAISIRLVEFYEAINFFEEHKQPSTDAVIDKVTT